MRPIVLTLPIPPRSASAEMLDMPDCSASELRANLADIRRLNSWFGGTSLAMRTVDTVLGAASAATILDVATGSADIPVALDRWARRKRRAWHITAVDIRPDIVAEARAFAAERPIEILQADALSLPWEDGSFDLVLCSLALHHFGPREAAALLAEMGRVARRSVVVIDLYRSYVAYAGVWLASRLIARSRMTRNDGPLSVLRAYTPAELRNLARTAGLDDVSVRRSLTFRQTLVARRSTSAHD